MSKNALTQFLLFSPDTINVLQPLTLMVVSSKWSTLSSTSTRTHQLLVSFQMKVSSTILEPKIFNQLSRIGVVLAAEKKETSKLFVPLRESGKLYKVDEHIMVAVSGIVADANYLIDEGRLVCQQKLYQMHSPIYVEDLVKDVANRKHYST